MTTLVRTPTDLKPADLDRVLSEGWYRIGQTLMTCHYVWMNQGVRDTLWLRRAIDDKPLSKSNRRLMRRNNQRFKISGRTMQLGPEHEALYERYLEVAPGERSPDIQSFLFGGRGDDRQFDTHQIEIWDETRLVGFSLFDLGRDSVQSLIGAYDPEYRKHSLGYWTLLLEMQYGRVHRKSWYYPGYVTPGAPSMDYKLRIGNCEWLDPDTRSWVPWNDWPEPSTLPSSRMRMGLEALRRGLEAEGVESRLEVYPMFDAPAWSPSLEGCVTSPIVLILGRGPGIPEARLVTHDPLAHTWDVLRSRRAVGIIQDAHGEELRRVQLWSNQRRQSTYTHLDEAIRGLTAG